MKKRKVNRILAFFLAALMVVSLLPDLGGIQANAAETTTYTFESTELPACVEADKETVEEGTKVGTDGKFVIVGTVTKRWNSADDKTVKVSEVRKKAEGAYSFTITGTGTFSADISSTGNTNTTIFEVVDANGTAIANTSVVTTSSSAADTDNTGKTSISITGANDAKRTATWENLPAGTYSIRTTSDCAKEGRVYKLTLVETAGASEPEKITTTYDFGTLTDTIQNKYGLHEGAIVDATAGKLAPNGDNCCANFTNGTKISVPVYGKSTITVTAHGSDGTYALYTINGEQASTTENATSVEYTGEAGMVDIVSTGNAYISKIIVEGPKPEKETITKLYDLGALTDTIQGSIAMFEGLKIDASAGKLRPNGDDCCANANAGTKISVPVYGDSIITVTAHGSNGTYALYTINGEAASTTNKATTVSYTGEAGYVDIISTDNNAYISQIIVTGPKPDVETVTTTYDFAEFVGPIQNGIGRFNGLTIDATTGKLASNGDNCCANFTTGAKISVPVYGDSVITVTAHGSNGTYALYTIHGTQASTTSNSTTIEYTGDEGYVDIISTGNGYIAKIVVVGPEGDAKPLPPIVNTATATQKADDPSGATVTITVTGTAGDAGTKYTIEASADEGATWKSVGTLDGSKAEVSGDVILNGYGTYIFRVKGENTVNATGTVTFEAADADTDPVTPSLENWELGQQAAETVGQKITLTNSALAITGLGNNIKTSGLGMFVFPATIGNNKLSVDLLINDVKGSILVGLFNESVANDDNGIRLITVGIRNNNNEIVNLMSKSAGEVIGKNSYKDSVTSNTPTMEIGDVINVTVSRDGSDVIFEVTNKTQGGDTYTMKRAYTNCAQFLNPGGEVYYGIMTAGKTAVVTNMVYTNANGAVLYDQNAAHAPLGTAPVVDAVTAEPTEERTSVNITWTGDAAENDEKFILEVLKPGANEWTLVSDEITTQSYAYPVAIEESGDYKFRVSGTLGNSAAQKEANKTTAKESATINIKAALPRSELTVDFVSADKKVVLTWTASEGAAKYEIYKGTASGELELLTEVTALTYTDEAVEDEGVYYYVVKALSADNFSPNSAEKWTLVSNGHSGNYSEEATINVTERSNNTVLTDKINLAGTVSAAGKLTLYVNGAIVDRQVVAANDAFEYTNVDLTAGRNEVELVLNFGEGRTTRVVYNYVYLIVYDLVVDGSSDATEDENGIPQYKTIAEALEAAKEIEVDGNLIIFIKNGNYNEQVTVTQPNVTLIGEDSVKTRIFYAAAEATRPDGTGYEGRSAFFVDDTATGFSAENLTIENSWAFDGKGADQQAEALYIEATNAVFVGVRFLSYQDTINQKNSSAYFLRCYVAGNVDYMWGVASDALYEDCDLVFRYNADKNSGYYTAYDPTSNVIYKDCRFTAEKDCSGTKYYLGRPYNNGTAVTLIDSYIGAVVNKEVGWTTWGQQPISSNKTDYNNTAYYEAGSYGPGYAVNVNRRQLSAAEAAAMITVSGLGWDPYTVANDINVVYGGDEYEGPISNIFEAGELTAKEDKEQVTPDTLLANGLVKVNGDVQKRTSKDVVKTIELAKAAGGSLSFKVDKLATFMIKVSSNGDDKPTKVQLLDAKGKPVADSEGRTVVELDGGDKSAIYVTYELTKGSYTFQVPEDFVDRGVRVYSFNLTTMSKATVETEETEFNPSDLPVEGELTSGTQIADGLITVNGTVNKNLSEDGTKVESLELSKAAGGSLDFKVEGKTTFSIELGIKNGVITKVELVDAKGNPVKDVLGRTIIEIATKTKSTAIEGTVIVNYNLEAGNYSFRVPEDYSETGATVYSIYMATSEDIDATGDFSNAGLYLIILLGAAFVALGFFTKKRFAR